MIDSETTVFSDDESGGILHIPPSRANPLRQPPSLHPSQSAQNEVSRLANSLYSYTYEHNTGSLLSIRLAAMQRSLLALHTDHQLNHNELTSLLKNLHSTTAQNLTSKKQIQLTIPLDDHLRQTDEDMLEFLTVPFMDLAPENKPFVRPPSMTRRASSMILQQNQLHKQPTQTEPTKFFGIPTPLPHQPLKGAKHQAHFTTELHYPFRIKTMNDVARAMLGPSQNENQELLANLISLNEEEINMKLHSNQSKTKLSGEIFLLKINLSLVSVWAEMPLNSAVLLWVLAPVPAIKVDLPSIHETQLCRVPLNSEMDVYLSGPGVWMPQNISSTLVVDVRRQQIVAYNKPSLFYMLGVEGDELVGKRIECIVPKWPELFEKVRTYTSNAGVVVSEHAFRQIAGVPLYSSQFVSPYPSRDPVNSIKAQHKQFSCCVDLQLRVISPEYSVLWISYALPKKENSNTATTTSSLLPQIVSVTSQTPPLTPTRTPCVTPTLRRSPFNSFRRKSDVYLDLSPSAQASIRATQSLEQKYMHLKVGERRRSLKIENFSVIKELGHGAYGEVKLVRTPTTDDVIALKSIFKDRILIDTWSRDRVLGTIPNEIRILNELRSSQHPNIVWMIDFFEDTKCYYLKMIPCGSPHAMDLFDFIETKSTKRSQTELLNIWRQIVSAVAHIHSLKIVHRDLKDENVIIDNEGVAKLIDFGSSAYIKQGPFDLFVGTVDYAAPEIVLGEVYNGIPQDVWALGILLYTILFGEVPFKDAHEIVEVLIPEKCSTSLGDTIIRAILKRDPAERPSALELLEMVPS